VKPSWSAILGFLIAILIPACTSATPEPNTARPPLPTANVPPVSDIDVAISRWEASNTTRYFADFEERTSEKIWKVRLAVADGGIRAAQKLEKDSSGNWGEPVALPLEEAQNYTVDALLTRIRRDATGSGPAPVNMRVAFDANSGFPAVVHAEALPVYDDEEGKIILDRRYSYDITLGLRPLLEDNYEAGRTPVLTLTRSGGPQAWCDSLRVYDDGAMIFTDDCRDRLLRLTLPASRQQALNDLRSSFGSLDELDEDGDQRQHLTIQGTGDGLPDQDSLMAAWELSLEAHQLASDPVGLGLAMGYIYQGNLIGFDVFNKQTLPSQITVEGEMTGAAIHPDGKLIAFNDDAGLKIMEIATSQVTLLIPSPQEGYYSPRRWSAGGRLLVSLVSESAGPDEQLGWISLEENTWHPLPRPEGVASFGCDTGTAWSPEGERLAITGIEYGHPCNTAGGLSIVDLESGEAQRIVAPAISTGLAGGEPITAGAHTPAWSQDGSWIAFGLDQDANAELSFPTRLYRAHPDGTQLTPLTNNSQGVAAYPAWAPDGSLYYSLSRAGAEVDGIYHYVPEDNTHTLLISGTDLFPISVSPDNGFLAYRQGNELNLWNIFLNEEHAGITGDEGSPPDFAGWLQASEQP
jgi:hypothetical protein